MSMNALRPTALITGASRGIGLAIAHELGSTHRILVGGRDGEAVAKVVAELPDAAPFVADLADEDEVARAAEGIESLDVLVHSAAVASYGPVSETSRKAWRDEFEVNLFAVVDLTQRLLPALRRASGIVVAINSGSGFNASPGNSVYAATKFALRAFADALREEERGRVRVTSIHPGRVDTDMQVDLQKSLGNDTYDGSVHIAPASVARTVRLAVDTTEEAMLETLSIRPVVKN